MSVIKYSLDRVMLAIPRTILDLAFMKKASAYRIQTTLEQQIQELVLNNIVLVDANIVGGITFTIPIDSCYVYEYEHSNYSRNLIIKVPFNLTNNKKIITALSLTANVTQDNMHNQSGINMVSQAGNQMYHLNGGAPGNIFTNLEIISSNTILVHDDVPFVSDGHLTVLVENNNNLSNIKPKSYPVFTELVVLAVKMFIFNKLVLELDKGALYYGHELGRMSDIINSYESAYEDYHIFLKEKWAKVAFMNDSVAMSNFVKMMVSPNI